MAKPLRTVTQEQLEMILLAREDVREGIRRLRLGGAAKAANAVARTLKSIDGAIRHAERIGRGTQLHRPTAVNPNPVQER